MQEFLDETVMTRQEAMAQSSDTPTREALYQQVWAEPMRVVAVRLGMSPAVLARLCRRMGVPFPRRGDRVRMQILGKAFHRPQLEGLGRDQEEATRRRIAGPAEASDDTDAGAPTSDPVEPSISEVTADEPPNQEGDVPAAWPRCLLADANARRRTELRSYLERYGLKVVEADSAEVVRRLVREQYFDVVLIDTALPDDRSHELCNWLHSVRSLLVILLASEYDLANWVLGFEFGASDCVSRLTSPRELVARIKAVMRRATVFSSPPDPLLYATVTVRGWSLDALGRQLVTPEHLRIDLSGAELRILWRLMAHVGRIQSRADLKAALADTQVQLEDRYIDAIVSRLRNRAWEISPGLTFIHTVRGEGYVFKV